MERCPVERISKSRSIQDQAQTYQITAEVIPAGRDLCVVISGGDQPHVGAVALATISPSSNDPHKQSATPSVIGVPGHKEYQLALTTAEQLSKALETTVAVSIGIHIDGISPELITRVEEEVHQLVVDLVERLREASLNND
jgi:hypothetical protein